MFSLLNLTSFGGWWFGVVCVGSKMISTVIGADLKEMFSTQIETQLLPGK